jgi:FKBP-type peptidyl-prolyl cis-trans isomerase
MKNAEFGFHSQNSSVRLKATRRKLSMMKQLKSNSVRVLTIAAIVAVAGLSACTKKKEETAPADAAATTGAPAAAAGTELKIEELKEGSGTEAKAGNTISVHYTGTLLNGTKFDSSLDRGEPFKFPLGGGRVIQGWDKGLVGMKVGGKRKLTIPSAMAYGEAGAPPVIPPNSALVFEVELLEVAPN